METFKMLVRNRELPFLMAVANDTGITILDSDYIGDEFSQLTVMCPDWGVLFMAGYAAGFKESSDFMGGKLKELAELSVKRMGDLSAKYEEYISLLKEGGIK